MTDPAATLKTGEQHPKLDETNRLNSLFDPEMQPVETKRIRKLKFAYPSGAQPLSGYTIKRGIGIGGFGEVYFALSDAGKEVALKRIQRNLDIELRGVRQCLNLKHINLIRLWDICTSDEGESWVVMEYVPGDSLRDIVEANPNGMPMDLVHQWFLSTAAGVAYLHSRGIVHRDLKPGNIFYDQDEQIIKIGDYGLSKFISCSRRSGQTESVGTFHYMAPEIGKGVYGKEIDIYALGIILFEIMTGNVPFDGESSQEIIMKHLTADPDVSKLPQLYGDIVRKAMHKDPEQRYRCVSEMVEDFPDDFKPADRIGPTPVSLTPSIVRNGSAATSSPINFSAQVNHQGNGVENREQFVDDATNGRNGNLKETRVPPIQPLIIDDNEIIFGDVREVVPAEQKATAGNDDLDVEVEHVEIVAADTGVSLVSASPEAHPEEPIAKAVTDGWSKFKTWWHSGKMNTPLKFFLVFIAAVVLIKNSEWILPSALGLGLMYLMYYAVRTWSLKPSKVKAEKNEAKPKVDLTSKFKPLSAREASKQTTSAIRHSLSQRTAPDRITELLGSMLVSAAIGLIIGMLGYAVATFNDESGLEIGSMIAWATAVSILSSWFLLLFGKFFEPSEGDAVLRRVSMLGVGILVGIAAASIGYMLELPYATSSDTSDSQLPLIADHLYFEQGGAWAAYVISFACLFAILRWWRQTDPVRKTRLSLVGTGICIIWATIFGSLFGIDLIWICVVAGVTAIITQLAAPWIHPKQRIQWIESRLDDNSATQVPATS